nr:hypothetical protein [uncultured Mediterranean phage uvMED]
MALVKYNNNSISAVTSASSIPVGAMTHIKTLTASSSATLSFVDGSSGVVLDSTYPIYKFEFINCHPATNGGHFTFNGSTDSGSNYNVTKTTTWFFAYHNEADSQSALTYSIYNDLAQSTDFQILASDIGNENDESASGEMFLYNPSSTTFVKHFISQAHDYNSNDYANNMFCSGYLNTTSAINAVQFKMNSGNIDAGKIKLYGIKDS